jgi:hypothetical protein
MLNKMRWRYEGEVADTRKEERRPSEDLFVDEKIIKKTNHIERMC